MSRPRETLRSVGPAALLPPVRRGRGL